MNLIQTPSDLRSLVDILSKENIIAFDTEFIRETTFFPQLEIIQVATASDAWIVDVQAFRKDVEGLKPFLDVLRDPGILKILHAAQADQECLFTAFGCIASPTLDTAIAASLCGYGDQQGLGNLLKSVLDVQLKKGHARTNWAVRPLPEQLVEYALDDVRYLVAMGQALIKELDELKRRDWAMELTAKWEDVAMYDPAPETLAAKIDGRASLDPKEFSALIELVRWREARVKQLNRPRKWIADDGILLNLAQVSPRDMEHLKAFRGIQVGEIQKSGEAILDAIRSGKENPIPHPTSRRKATPAEREMTRPPSARESQALSLLQCYIGILADQHRVAVRHIVMSQQLLPLMRTSTVESAVEWMNQGLLSRWAGELIGQEILEFLRGEKALTLDRVKGVKVTQAK